MNKLFLLLVLCAVAVNARWSLNYQGKAEGDDHDHDHDELDWWEHSTFYQVRHVYSKAHEIENNFLSCHRSTRDHSKTVTAMVLEISTESSKSFLTWLSLESPVLG